MTDKYVAIVTGFRGPTLQLWHEMRTDGNGKPQPTLVPPIKLEGKQLDMSITQLEEEFKHVVSGLSGDHQ